jgi:choline dehydrogenase-like flavoprotein
MDVQRLRAAVDAVVPRDDVASASEAGGLRYWARLLEHDRPEWTDRVTAVLDLLDERAGGRFADLDAPARERVLDGLLGNAEYLWFADAVNAGFYADPGNLGNDGAVSWRMVGWDPGAPPVREVGAPAVLRPADLRTRYDAVVVGSGAGGGVAAWALARSGRSVLLVERGGLTAARNDHLRSPRVDGSLAYTFGGGTRVYGAQAWRFTPEDFAMAATYGVPDGSALADWPIGYDDLEPFYTRAEYEIGVCGSDAPHTGATRRSRPYPMPPGPVTESARRLGAAARTLGLSTVPVPLAVNSVPYDGRPACAACRECVGFACPVDAKNGSHNTVLARAAATGNLSVLLDTRVRRVVTDARGRVSGVDLSDGRRVDAADVVVAAGAVESARLLLCSPSDREPDGLGNNHDLVGRHLQGHVYGGAVGVFDDVVADLVGPGPAISTHDFRHHNDGLVGGGMLADEFVPTPVNTYAYLRQAGLIGPHGLAAKNGMRHLTRRMQRVVGPVQEVTSAESRVRVDRSAVDRHGIPVAVLSGGLHRNDLAAQRLLGERAADWLRAAGATTAVAYGPPRADLPSSGQHQAGTCRMGTDPRTSVTDPDGRVWGHDNLRVVDASVHVTNGGVNPVLTVFANAFRVMHHWLDGSEAP